MNSRSTEAIKPPWTENHAGETRCVGVEVEFSGLPVDRTAEIIRELFGGHVERVSDYEHRVQATELGDFGVEVDLQLLKKLGQKVESDPEDAFTEAAARMLSSVAEVAVPMEVVAPPVPWHRLTELDRLVAQLRDEGARGTRNSAIYAFGVHLNPDIPSREPQAIGAFLRAFAALFDWLVHTHEVDFSRRISPFIRRYPVEYEQLILAEDYQPDMAQLIEDYLTHNASRNRALDMLPLFAWIDEERIRDRLPEEKINARPTFHYRLPNSEIDLDRWSLLLPWQRWLAVERVAAAPEQLEAIARARLERLERGGPFRDTRWLEELGEQWPDLLSSA